MEKTVKSQASLERRAEIGKEKRARTKAILLRAAFDILGREYGRISQVDEIVAQAGIARGTFYNYFSTIDELYHDLSYDLTHEYNTAVYRIMDQIETPAEKVAVGIRSYLQLALKDRRWGWGMVNMCASGPLFGAETFNHACITTEEGIISGDFTCGTGSAGRDFQLGALMAGMTALLRGAGAEHGDMVALAILRGMGVPQKRAKKLIAAPLLPIEISK